jgi:hypothetical protein
MSALHANVAVLVSIMLLGLSTLLAGVGFLTWRRVGHPKLGWVAFAFVMFALQGLYFVQDTYARRGELAQGWDAVPGLALVNLLIVVALYMAVLKR